MIVRGRSSTDRLVQTMTTSVGVAGGRCLRCALRLDQVALAAEKNGAMVRRIANALSVAPLMYTLRRNDKDYVVFCFAKAEHAEAFRETFGGERLATGSRR
jgi:hypothetical protein